MKIMLMSKIYITQTQKDGTLFLQKPNKVMHSSNIDILKSKPLSQLFYYFKVKNLRCAPWQ